MNATTPQLSIYNSHIEAALRSCLESAYQYRIENCVNELPSSMIQGLITEHIAPLAGESNTLNIKILEGKTDWRRNATELGFRKILQNIGRDLESGDPYNRAVDCLDAALYCSEIDLVDNVIPLTLIEELLDNNTTIGCEKIFDYIEKRRTRITVNMESGRGKGLVLLRMCNELLRRLSKETNTVFCGRILMFLANTFPLDERSGVNLGGDFNSDMISFDTDEQVDADPDMTAEEKEFYKTFWSVRTLFANPPKIQLDDNFSKLQQGTTKILERLQIIAAKEAEILGARKSEIIGLKRKNTTDSSLEFMEEDSSLPEQLLAEINREFQFPRLLSSRKLLGLELEDVRFRRHVILQYLIVLQYLAGFSVEEKAKTAELVKTRETNGKRPAEPKYEINQEQVDWILATRDELVSLLRLTKPHGNLYTDIILTMLENERFWIIWKAAGCPRFKKPPVTISDLKNLKGKWESKRNMLSKPPATYRYTYGNDAVTKIYNGNKTPLSEFMIKRPKLQLPLDILTEAIESNEDIKDAQEKFKHANGVLLQVSRFIYREHPSLIRNVYTAKRDIYKELNIKLKENKMDESETPKVSALLDFVVGEEYTDDRAEAEFDVLKKVKDTIMDVTTIKIDDDTTNVANTNTEAAT